MRGEQAREAQTRGEKGAPGTLYFRMVLTGGSLCVREE